MKNVILFGATGNLGKEIATELKQQGYWVTAVVRNEKKKQEIKDRVHQVCIADVTKPADLAGICQGQEVVISALGKSVSPNDKSKATFQEIDLEANSAILQDALTSSVNKFVYVSAFHSERYPKLEYFRVHHQFSERLKQSGLDYSIIKPPAIFSAFLDMIEMAQKGQLVTLGAGDKKTNPIYEGDLAKICVAAINQQNATIEAGGKEIFTRKELNEIIQEEVTGRKQVRSVPIGLVKCMLPLIKLVNQNSYDKLAFFTEVMQHDTIAPQVGITRFADYVAHKINKNKNAAGVAPAT